MNDVNYNILNLSIDQGLKNLPIASGKNYLILLSAPPGANVRVKLNNNSGDDIPLKENYAIKSTDIQNIYISADSVANGVLVFGQANSADSFEIITAPTINSIESIGEIVDFNEVLLNKLDKIINPYDFFERIFSTSGSATSIVTMLDTILDCDKIIIHCSPTKGVSNSVIQVTIDSKTYVYNNNTNGAYNFSLTNIRNKNLLIKGLGYSFATIEKYNIKV